MRLHIGLALAMIASAAAFADPPADAVDQGEELKAAAIAKWEADIEAAMQRKAEAGKADNRPLVKQVFVEIKSLKAQLLRVKAKTPEQFVAEEEEKARIAKAEAENRARAAKAARAEVEANRPPPRKQGMKWYEGGTLHNANALEWQRASQEDRLATCADFVVKAHTAGLLTRQISRAIGTVDDARPYAVELKACLNNAFNPEADAVRNSQLFTNQTVAAGATACMILMGWVEK